MDEQTPKEPMSREEVRATVQTMAGEYRRAAEISREIGLVKSPKEDDRRADALQFLLDSEGRKTKALEEIAEMPRSRLTTGGWHVTDIQDLQTIAEAALKPQEPQGGKTT
ncbi:MAG TPA: hypothetical protein VGK74_02480 [Symbiobacteriaceae bacterium]|jgi:hypothetical protein